MLPAPILKCQVCGEVNPFVSPCPKNDKDHCVDCHATEAAKTPGSGGLSLMMKLLIPSIDGLADGIDKPVETSPTEVTIAIPEDAKIPTDSKSKNHKAACA